MKFKVGDLVMNYNGEIGVIADKYDSKGFFNYKSGEYVKFGEDETNSQSYDWEVMAIQKFSNHCEHDCFEDGELTSTNKTVKDLWEDMSQKTRRAVNCIMMNKLRINKNE